MPLPFRLIYRKPPSVNRTLNPMSVNLALLRARKAMAAKRPDPVVPRHEPIGFSVPGHTEMPHVAEPQVAIPSVEGSLGVVVIDEVSKS